MRLSILDGCLFCAMVGVAEQYLVPFAVSLGAGPGEVALLVGLPLLAGSLGQLWAPALVRRTGSRRQVVHALALLQATAWLPISLLAWRGPSALALAALIVAVVAYQAAGHFIGPIWTDWMGDLVPLDGRGRYFGRRNLWCGLVNVATFLGTGLALAALAPGGRGVTPAYAGLFLAGFFLRAGSALCLGAQAEPVPPRAGEALGAGVREALESLFRGAGVRGLKRGIALLVLMAFSVHVAVPFFTPYLLRELALSYGTYALVLGSGALAKFLAMPLWGRAIDRFGSRGVLLSGALCLPAVPALWCVARSPAALMATEVFGGVAWAAYELGAFHFLLDAIAPERRLRVLSILQAATGVAVFLGMGLGTRIAGLGQVEGSEALWVIAVSAAMRCVVALGFAFLLVPAAYAALGPAPVRFAAWVRSPFLPARRP